jgi:putative redox protein
MDASGVTGPSPVDTLLCALAGCTGVDVVDILAKRRTPVQALSVDVEGERFAGVPGRVTAIKLHYRIIGAEVERQHAERAIELAVTKYCSVRDSLDPHMPVTWTLELNGG